MNKGGLILRKQEMTRLWVDGKQVPVTLLKIIPQEIIRYKTQEKDGYDSVVVGSEKESLDKNKGVKVKYKHICEFPVDEEFKNSNAEGKELNISELETIEEVTLKTVTKGKGFQGVIRKFGWSLGPKTHGSKFHRGVGALGNRKPNRTLKGKKLPGHMGLQTRTLKKVPVVKTFNIDGDQLVAVKGSVPGAYNSYVKIEL